MHEVETSGAGNVKRHRENLMTFPGSRVMSHIRRRVNFNTVSQSEIVNFRYFFEKGCVAGVEGYNL